MIQEDGIRFLTGRKVRGEYMNDSQETLSRLFSKNRAEEFGYDVWEHFVIPPFFDQLDLKEAKKPRIIIGGRGSGKTMLLRYLSHQTMFSPKREGIPDESISHIGLYWRVDTQFAAAMDKRGVYEDTWQSAFDHLAALMLGMEVLNSLKSIALSASQVLEEQDLAKIDFQRLNNFNKNLPSSFNELYLNLEELLWAFRTWVNNVRKQKEPEFLPGLQFVRAMIQSIKEKLPFLEDANFAVYIDEYENLCRYQQRIINTWLKHSEIPLIFNLAMKRNAFETRETLSFESLSDIHDFRTHDLDIYYQDTFEVFAAEILFLKLSSLEMFDSCPVDVNTLRDSSALRARREDAYKQEILKVAHELFPTMSQRDLAKQVFKDRALLQKLQSKIERALNYGEHKIDPKLLFRTCLPEATVIIPSLLYRRLKIEDILEQLGRLENEEENRFTGKTSWIHNNFIDCLLQLYAPYSRSCPFYAGFQTFCQLAKGNIRHFLELCHKSLRLEENHHISVDPTQQAEAARQASADFLKEIRSFGKYGNRLHTFVLRLGSLFQLAREDSKTSIAEQTHFSVTSGSGIAEQENSFINEAVKHSVLLEFKDTKKKSQYQPESIEYVLNPIYAPFFHISYRKKRKLEISSEDLVTIINGTYDQFRVLMKSFENKWVLDSDEYTLPLFSAIEEN